MERSKQQKRNIRSRGELLLSLVPKVGIPSDPESDEEEQNDDMLEHKIQNFFNTFVEDYGEDYVQQTMTNLNDPDSDFAPDDVVADDFNDPDPEVVDTTTIPDEPRADAEFATNLEGLDFDLNVYEAQPSTSSTPDLSILPIDDVIPPQRSQNNVRRIIPTRVMRQRTQTQKTLVAQANQKKRRQNPVKKKKPTFFWKRGRFKKGVTLPPKEIPRDEGVQPLEYFKRFFTDELIALIVQESNTYSTQQFGKCADLNSEDIWKFLAIEMHMGIVVMPSFRDYWALKTRYGPVASIMSRNHYQKIRRNLHFANNDELNDDAYYKVRPVVEYLRKKFVSIEPEQYFSVDEMMVGYKGKKAGGRKQFMKNKPTKWGFKFFTRSGSSGIVYDFMIFEWDKTFRSISFTEEEKERFTFSTYCVIALAKSIESPALTALFFDNFFCSPQLMSYLRYHYGILSIGTLRANRLEGAGSKLISDKEIAKKGRGALDTVCDNKNNVCVVKWFDKKSVLIGSTYTSIEPMGVVERWSRGVIQKQKVPCPSIIKGYNKFMGGVDKSDMLVALYKTPLRTYKWYMRIFAHTLDLALNNSWLLYKRDNNNSKKCMGLKEFKLEVAESIVYAARSNTKKYSLNDKNSATTPPPPTLARFDGVGHFPQFSLKGRCRFCHKGQTTVHCLKCNIRLCFIPNRNCFYAYHHP